MKRGFTLIELLIVLGVIAIIASILVPNIQGMREQGDIVAAQGDLSTLQSAIESYANFNNRQYPEYLTELLSVTPRIINKLPKDRFNPSAPTYNYLRSSDGDYVVWSNGPNKKQDFKIQTPPNGPPYIEESSIGDDILESSYLIE